MSDDEGDYMLKNVHKVSFIDRESYTWSVNFRPFPGRKSAIFGRNRTRHKMAISDKEFVQRQLRKCFTPEEWEILLKDDIFRKQVDQVDTLDELEKVVGVGSKLLYEVEFPDEPKGRPSRPDDR